MAEAIKAATVGVIDKIAAGTTAVADKVGLTTPSSQTSLAPNPPAVPAEHVDPPAPQHLPPGGGTPPHPPPLPAAATSVSAGGKEETPVGRGAGVAQPVAAAEVTAAPAGAGAGGAPTAAPHPLPVPVRVEMVKEPTVPVVAVAAPVAASAAAAPVVAPAAAAAPMEAAPAAGDGKRAVTFTWADAAPVVVKGSWDNWQGAVDCTGTGGVVRLAPGTYHYKYVVGGQYVCDPLANSAVDASGNQNNVMVIE